MEPFVPRCGSQPKPWPAWPVVAAPVATQDSQSGDDSDVIDEDKDDHSDATYREDDSDESDIEVTDVDECQPLADGLASLSRSNRKPSTAGLAVGSVFEDAAAFDRAVFSYARQASPSFQVKSSDVARTSVVGEEGRWVSRASRTWRCDEFVRSRCPFIVRASQLRPDGEWSVECADDLR